MIPILLIQMPRKERVRLTVADKLRQTLVTTKNVSAQLEQYALDTQNKQAQQTFQVLARQCSDIAGVLQTRLLALENEEPQYKS